MRPPTLTRTGGPFRIGTRPSGMRHRTPITSAAVAASQAGVEGRTVEVEDRTAEDRTEAVTARAISANRAGCLTGLGTSSPFRLESPNRNGRQQSRQRDYHALNDQTVPIDQLDFLPARWHLDAQKPFFRKHHSGSPRERPRRIVILVDDDRRGRRCIHLVSERIRRPPRKRD